MSTLFHVETTDHQVFACNDRCYNATGDLGGCICGGRNRGLGFAKARRQTLLHWKTWVDQWIQAHPEQQILTVDLGGLSDRRQLRIV